MLSRYVFFFSQQKGLYTSGIMAERIGSRATLSVVRDALFPVVDTLLCAYLTSYYPLRLAWYGLSPRERGEVQNTKSEVTSEDT